MKKFIVLLLLISNYAASQEAKKQLKVTAAPIVVDKQAKARMQVGNKNNDKFLNKYNYQNNNQTIVCESNRGRRSHCRVDTRYGVSLVRQLSGSSCNYNWGYDDTGIWVDGGCRAEFSVNYGWDQPGAEGNIMVCESHNYQRNYCTAYLGGRDVFLLRQVSNSSCINNWGYDQNGVWVTNGCRAEFVVEDRGYNFGDDTVVCSSRNLRFQGCPADTRGGVEFIRQLSRSSCNGNWGYDQQGIWVTNGCRAKFKLQPYQNYNPGYRQQNTIVSCSSRNHQRQVCRVDTSGGVTLKRQKSRASCVGNWGFDRNGIWVTNGCRATFELNVNRRNNGGYGQNNGNNGYGQNNSRYGNNRNGNNNGYGQNNQGYGNNNGTGNNNGYGQNNNYGNNNGNTGYGNQTNRIVCSSQNLARRSCAIPNGAKVQLHKQLSKTSCVGKWGYNRREIWVTNGCRAEFSVF